MRLIDADELTEMVWRERVDSRERIAELIARQPIRQYVDTVQARVKSKSAATRALELIEKDFPDIAEKYFDIKFSDYDGCGHKVIC